MRPVVRSFALLGAMLSTAWLLVADSAEKCERPAEVVEVRMRPPCAADFRLRRDANTCDAKVESTTSNTLDADSSTHFGSIPIAESYLQIQFQRLRRDDQVELYDGSCDFDPQNKAYSCYGKTSSTAASSHQESCEGTYEIL